MSLASLNLCVNMKDVDRKLLPLNILSGFGTFLKEQKSLLDMVSECAIKLLHSAVNQNEVI